MSAPIAVAENLGKDFREGFRMSRRPALESVSFSLDAGIIYGFLGPNGAGKSTTIHLMMGFLRPSRGRALLFGRSPSDPSSRLNVGFLPEIFAFDRFSTGSGLLRRFDALTGRPAEGRDGRVRSAIDAVDLGPAASRRIGSYSKGMTQRIGLAQAMLGDPDLLVLDEPMSGMDPATRHSVRDLLSRRRGRGKTTLLSSHILADVEALADRVLILDRGRVVAEGPLGALDAGKGGSVIVFRDEKPERFDSLLAELGLSREHAGEPPGCHRVVAVDPVAKNRCLARLAHDGADIVSVTPQRASLEAIFLKLTGGDTEASRGRITERNP